MTIIPDNNDHDQELKTKIAVSLQKLQQSANLRVTVKAGIVYLDGQVAKPDDEKLACHLVSRIPGVKEVISRLKPAAASSPDDKAIAVAVEAALDRSQTIIGENITVHSDRGSVYLNGWVENQEMKTKATQVAAAVAGVAKVVNDLLVEEDQTDSDASLTGIIRQTLGQIIPGCIRVIVLRGWVYLTGEVDTIEQKEAVEGIINYINDNIDGLEGLKNDVKIRLH